jgi:hypothetical protein
LTRSRWHLCARVLLLFLFLVNLYRARTQSITTDEAFTYNRSVSAPIPALWKDFDANDHVLHTLLCKVTTGMFGVSEFTLRIPALAGGILYFWTVWAFSRLLFRDGPFFLLSVAALALNPLILDYCSIARGYGMATALLLLALYQLLRFQKAVTELWRMNVAGVALALGVAANLTVALPGVVLMTLFSAQYLGECLRPLDRDRLGARASHLIDRMVVPGIVITVTLLLFPLMPARRESFYVGATRLADSVTSLIYACLWRPGNPFENSSLHQTMESAILIAGWYVLPGVFAVAFFAAAIRRRITTPLTWLFLLTVLTAGLQMALHHWSNVPYPERRTGLYYVPLLTLLGLETAFAAPKLLRTVSAAVALCMVALFLLLWNVRYYDEWLFDASTRDLMRSVQANRSRFPVLRLTASWPLLHGAIFYRSLYKLDWLEIPHPNERPKEGQDLYLLAPEDWSLIEKWGLEVLEEHPVSHVRLAARRGIY